VRENAAERQTAGSTVQPLETASIKRRAIAVDKPVRRMPLRQLLTHSEKCSRDLIEHLRASLGPSLSEFRELSRPVRRRSHYPSMVTIRNALKKVTSASEEAQKMAEYLRERLEEIQKHGRRS
jgi:hypothetical protein